MALRFVECNCRLAFLQVGWCSAVLFSAPAFAQDTVRAPETPGEEIVFAVFGDVRLRHEHAESDNLPRDSDALTLRARAGAELDWHGRLLLLGEVEGGVAIIDDYFDTFGPLTDRPPIADAEFFELNRLQVSARLAPFMTVTLGRQDMALDDERFLGASGFRQDMQTFDGVRASLAARPGWSAELGYFNRVNRSFPDDSATGAFRSDSWFFRLGAPTPIGQLSAYHFAFDIASKTDRDAGSTRSTGLRLEGKEYRGETGLLWEAALARQQDHAANARDFSVGYAMANLALDTRNVRVDVRAEILGSDQGVAFQTPLGTNHRFQGAADVFLVTPPDGLEDYSVRLLTRLGSTGPLRAITASIEGHVFGAAAGSADYGRELDLSLAAAVFVFRASVDYARYFSEGFAQDQSRLWLTLTRNF